MDPPEPDGACSARLRSSIGAASAPADALSPPVARSVVELQGALRSDWAQFRQNLDDAVCQQVNRQEEIIVRCIENLASNAQANTASHAQAAAYIGPRFSVQSYGDESDTRSGVMSITTSTGTALDRSARSVQRKGSRLWELSTNIGQISPPSGSRPSVVATCGGRSNTPTAPSSVAVSMAGSFSTVDPGLAAVQGALGHLDSAIGRVEHLLLKQEQRVFHERERASAAVSLRGMNQGGQQDALSVVVDVSSGSQKDSSGHGPTHAVPPLPSASSGDDANRSRSYGSDLSSKGNSPCWRSQSKNKQSITDIMEGTKDLTGGFFRRKLEKRFSSTFGWWDSIEEPGRDGALADIVQSKGFDFLCALVIICNAVFTWVSTNYEITHLETGMTTSMLNVERAFVCFYITELAMKLAVHRGYFFCNQEMQWNIFDMVLVLFSLCDQVLTFLSESSSSRDVTFMRTLRILKMAKILRGLRVMRFFSELRLMLNSLIGSLTSLMWSIVMMALVFYLFGLIFVQGAALHLYLHGEDMSEKQIDGILLEFGSVQSAMLALYRACTGGDDWAYFYDIILTTGAPYACLFIFFIAFSQIAILNILTAIFVNNAMELARPDTDTLAIEHRKKEIEAYEELLRLCETMDHDGSGTVSIEELSKQLQYGRLGARLSVLGLNVTDAETFFELLLFTTNGATGNLEDKIHISDFVEGCMRMRGLATGINVQSVAQDTRLIFKTVRQIQKDHAAKLRDLTNLVDRAATNSWVTPAPSGGSNSWMAAAPSSPKITRQVRSGEHMQI